MLTKAKTYCKTTVILQFKTLTLTQETFIIIVNAENSCAA